jgi:hypothetical protein
MANEKVAIPKIGKNREKISIFSLFLHSVFRKKLSAKNENIFPIGYNFY